jgi:putative flippase GtrA
MTDRRGGAVAHTTATRFVKFAGVGVVGFFVDAAILQIQLSFLGISPYVARLVSYLAAASVTWWLNRKTSFPEASTGRPVLQWGRFVAANAIGGSVNYSVSVALIASVPLTAQHPVLAVAAGSISGLVINFFLSKRYVFRISTRGLDPSVVRE